MTFLARIIFPAHCKMLGGREMRQKKVTKSICVDKIRVYLVKKLTETTGAVILKFYGESNRNFYALLWCTLDTTDSNLFIRSLHLSLLPKLKCVHIYCRNDQVCERSRKAATPA